MRLELWLESFTFSSIVQLIHCDGWSSLGLVKHTCMFMAWWQRRLPCEKVTGGKRTIHECGWHFQWASSLDAKKPEGSSVWAPVFFLSEPIRWCSYNLLTSDSIQLGVDTSNYARDSQTSSIVKDWGPLQHLISWAGQLPDALHVWVLLEYLSTIMQILFSKIHAYIIWLFL